MVAASSLWIPRDYVTYFAGLPFNPWGIVDLDPCGVIWRVSIVGGLVLGWIEVMTDSLWPHF